MISTNFQVQYQFYGIETKAKYVEVSKTGSRNNSEKYSYDNVEYLMYSNIHGVKMNFCETLDDGSLFLCEPMDQR